MKLHQKFIIFIFTMLITGIAYAQDAVIIEEGNFVRGTIKGTDFATVQLLKDDQTLVLYKAKDIKEFLWNGDTFVSKPVVIKKKMEFRFFKIEEHGTVNLYSIGNINTAEPQAKRVSVRPSIGVGLGSGGYGGVGFGGGISIGGGRRDNNRANRSNNKVTYYLERLGTGPLLELPLDGTSSAKTEQVKYMLLQKLSNDEDLAERIKTTDSFDAKNVQAFVSAYNAMHK